MATMNKKNTQGTHVVELDKVYTTSQVCKILSINKYNLNSYLHLHPALKPSIKIEGAGNGKFMWTESEVKRLRKYYTNRRHKSANVNPTTLATPTTSQTTLATPQTNTLVDMFNEFINIETEEQANENRAANRKFRSLFEKMTEKDMQRFFAPMLERFKYAFITRNVNNVQSQTLTCIKNGKLKGISKYQLTYSAFLELCKFAAENNCPLNLPTTEA